jgi:hypothetical protein
VTVLVRHDPSVAPQPLRDQRAERDLVEAETLLRRLLATEDRPGLVYPLIDDARRFLARPRDR